METTLRILKSSIRIVQNIHNLSRVFVYGPNSPGKDRWKSKAAENNIKLFGGLPFSTPLWESFWKLSFTIRVIAAVRRAVFHKGSLLVLFLRLLWNFRVYEEGDVPAKSRVGILSFISIWFDVFYIQDFCFVSYCGETLIWSSTSFKLPFTSGFQFFSHYGRHSTLLAARHSTIVFRSGLPLISRYLKSKSIIWSLTNRSLLTSNFHLPIPLGLDLHRHLRS